FFFQAEDGIRDKLVTGVQTCLFRSVSDKNVVVVDAGSRRVGFLSRTCAGRAADKGIADRERIAYPPGTVLHKDSGFQPLRARGRSEERRVGEEGRGGGGGGRAGGEW